MSQGARPAVSIIVPFLGDAAAAASTLAALEAVELAPGDELIVADNTPSGVFPEGEGRSVVRAGERRSAYHARNAAAARASAPWLLFTDADCRPPADLLARLLEPPPADDCAIVAGEVTGDAAQGALLARWARSRRGAIVAHHLDDGPAPAGTTANLLVRRAEFEAVGGFADGVRSAADVDLCWRIAASGGRLEYRPQALVLHRDPERLGVTLRQAERYGAGRRWLRGVHGESVARAPLAAPLVRAVGGAAAWALRLRFERAAFKLIDGANALAVRWGWTFGSNRPR